MQTFVKPSPGTTIRSSPPEEMASSLSSSSEQEKDHEKNQSQNEATLLCLNTGQY